MLVLGYSTLGGCVLRDIWTYSSVISGGCVKVDSAITLTTTIIKSKDRILHTYITYTFDFLIFSKSFCILACAQLWTPTFMPHAFPVQIRPNNYLFLIYQKTIQNSHNKLLLLGVSDIRVLVIQHYYYLLVIIVKH